MRKIVLLMLIVMTISGCGSDKGNKLVIGIDDDFPPLSFRDESGEIVGFDVDLAKETMQRMGVEAEFKTINWDDKEEAIISGTIDMVWSGLDITDKRKEYMTFIRPYMDDRQIVLVRLKSDLEIYSEHDFKGKVIGTQRGSTSDEYINKDSKLRASIADYKTYEKFGEALTALRKGELEIIICDELIARYVMNTYPNQFRTINVEIGTVAKTSVGFRKDDTALRDNVQRAFDTMIRDGTATAISMRWFNADVIKH